MERRPVVTYSNMDNVPTQTAGTSELLASDWNTYVRDNFDAIKFGHVVCTSGTRPTGVGEGTMIYETDTNKVYVYDGASWDEVHDLDNTANLPDGGAALSVLGNGTNAAAARTDIAAGTDGHVLRRSGTSLEFGTIDSNSLANNAVTLSKISPSGSSSGQVLTSSGSATTPTWATPSSAQYTTLVAYSNRTATKTFSTTLAATGNCFNADFLTFTAVANTTYKITVYIPIFYSGTTLNGLTYLVLTDGADNNLGILAACNCFVTNQANISGSVYAEVYVTPGAGSKTYNVSGYTTNQNGGGFYSGPGGASEYFPATIRIWK